MESEIFDEETPSKERLDRWKDQKIKDDITDMMVGSVWLHDLSSTPYLYQVYDGIVLSLPVCEGLRPNLINVITS